MGTKSLAALVTERPHGKGEQKVFHHDALYGNILFVVSTLFQVLRAQLDFSRRRPPLFRRMQHLSDDRFHGKRKPLQTPAAFEAEGDTNLTVDENVPASLPNKDIPVGALLDGEIFQALPSGLLASKSDVQAALRNVGIA